MVADSAIRTWRTRIRYTWSANGRSAKMNKALKQINLKVVKQRLEMNSPAEDVIAREQNRLVVQLQTTYTIYRKRKVRKRPKSDHKWNKDSKARGERKSDQKGHLSSRPSFWRWRTHGFMILELLCESAIWQGKMEGHALWEPVGGIPPWGFYHVRDASSKLQ